MSEAAFNSEPADVERSRDLDPATTAVLLVGFQREFFSPDGALRDAVGGGRAADEVLARTKALVEAVAPTDAVVVSTPIVFSADDAELIAPVGVLAAIQACGAFKEGTPGAGTVDDIDRFGDRVLEVPGRRGFNAFTGTDLDGVLRERGVRDVVVAGALACLCVDSTARAAHERGYRVAVLSDCTVDRTRFDQQLFCDRIFPLYADVLTSDDLLEGLGLAPPAAR